MARRQVGFIVQVEIDEAADEVARRAPALARIATVPLDPSITFLVGPNGSGKSTLLEEMADDPYISRSDVFAPYGGLSPHEESHGESFLNLVIARFAPGGLYLLDEPEAALSPQGQLTLLRRLHELIEEDCQFIVATHSPILVALPGAMILAMGNAGIDVVDYDEVEHVQLYRSFLSSPERFLRHLLADEDGI